MILGFVRRNILAPLHRFIDVLGGEIVRIIYHPHVLIPICEVGCQLLGSFKQGGRIIPSPLDLEVNPFWVLPIDGIHHAGKIVRFRFGSLGHNQMILWMNPLGIIPPGIHPAFAQIALLGRFQAHANSPPSILER